MPTYRKPLVTALSMESEQSGCNFFVNDAGEGFFIYTEGGVLPPSSGGATIGTPIGGIETPLPATPNVSAIPNNNIASVGDGSASVTPLANTNLPATNPIVIGVPVGLYGVNANVGPGASSTSVGVNSDALAVHVFGQVIAL